MPEVRLLELRNTYKWGGGPDKTILLSAERHNTAKVKVVVVYIRDVRDRDFQITETAKTKGLTFYEVPESCKFDPRVLLALRKIAIRHDINLIHSHDYKSDLFAYLLRRWLWRRSIALLSTAHAWVMMGPRGELYRRLDLFLMKRFDRLIAVSEATRTEMIAAGVPKKLITVIHNAIDTDTWSAVRVKRDQRTKLGLTGAFPVIGYAGRIMPEKDLETWLHAAAPVAKRFPNARFVWVGEGRDSSTQGELERLATLLGIRDRITFAGYQRDLPPLYATFDVFLLTSRREGLPNSLLEAMAMSLPVVTTDVAGAKELVVEGETGLIRPQGDVPGLSQALLALAANDTLRLRMGRKGRERVEQEFSFGKRLAKIESLYGSMVSLRTNSIRAVGPSLN